MCKTMCKTPASLCKTCAKLIADFRNTVIFGIVGICQRGWLCKTAPAVQNLGKTWASLCKTHSALYPTLSRKVGILRPEWGKILEKYPT